MSQGIACLMIGLNRCSAVIWPLNYERVCFNLSKFTIFKSFQIWSNRVIYFSVFFQIFSGLPFAVFAGLKDYIWITNITTAEEYGIDQPDVKIMTSYNTEIQILKIIWVKTADSKLVYSVGFVIEIIVCFLLIVCYIIMGCMMKKRKVS